MAAAGLTLAFCLFLSVSASGVVHYVDVNSTNATPPYTNWATAAVIIQDAVDAAAPGDEIVVSNGVYSTGGRAVYGTMTNRVAVDKPLTVRSANGPQFTVIQGRQAPGTTNGDGAIRCAYLTNGVTLSGFTLANGATRSAGSTYDEQAGGGVWCKSASVAVTNCAITGNSAYYYGGGAYRGTLRNCTLTGNSARYGGGAGGSWFDFTTNCFLHNCTLAGNSAIGGGGSFIAVLNNCTLTGNSATWGGGAAYGALTNSILCFNTAMDATNYGACTLIYCCTTPLPAVGSGNLSLDPQLASASHLSASSPCRGAGSAGSATGVDIDGEAWGSPPSIGCDEYWAGAVTGPLNVAMTVAWTNVAAGYSVDFRALIEGRASASAWDFGDGVVLSNSPYATHAWVAPGDYAVRLTAYNESQPGGASAVVTVHVVTQPVHYVSAGSTNATPPYLTWATAATNIQDAVDAATMTGALLLVSNGVYSTGGRAVYGTMTNRVAVDKPLIVHSVNGPQFTAIQGYQVPGTTNGGGAIRCAYLANGATLAGFTLTHGATQTNGDYDLNQSGGGLSCEGFTAVVSNCVLTDNSAYYGGGGVDGGTLNNCTLTGNSARYGGGSADALLNSCTLAGNSAGGTNVTYGFTYGGGGSYACTLNNCTLTGNSATGNDSSRGSGGGGSYYGTLNNCTLTSNSANGTSRGGSGYGGGAYDGTLNNCTLTRNSANGTFSEGGGSYDGTLNNCTLTGNSAASFGGGSYFGTLNNCIVWGNTRASGSPDNYSGGTLRYTCASPLATGEGNISSEPQLADGVHLAATSPCRGAGSANYTTGTDIDGQPWLNPPSMGCDEWHPEPAIAAPQWQFGGGVGQAVLAAVVAGQGPFDCWWSKDGLLVEDGAHYDGTRSAKLLVRGLVPEDAGGYRLVVSNAFGVVTSQVTPLVVLCVAAAGSSPAWPYATWDTAATTIQDAVEVATVGALVLVTNGLYASGGKVMTGDLTNRVALDKAVAVLSVSGPQATVIQGQWPAITNGPGAVRCAWLANGAVLNGFTLRGGATRMTLDSDDGGGVWCSSTNATVANCTLTGNSAWGNGGGSYDGTLNNCTLTGNSANSGFGNGGGAYYGTLNNCLVAGNLAGNYGGGVCGDNYLTDRRLTLNNCTLTGNSAAYFGGGSYNGILNNCIVWGNTAPTSPNYSYGTLRYTCASPLASGEGNLAADPQWLADGVHLAATSPCRGAGSTNYTTGTDYDGQPWLSPPSMGCDEWHPEPAMAVPRWQFRSGVGQAVLAAVVAGQGPFDYGWSKDGLPVADGAHYDGARSPNMLVRGVVPEDAGVYQVVASNAFGLVTSQVVPLVIHCVDAAGSTPALPYASWATAALTIQDAVDGAAPGEVVLVTNGVYASGGKVMAGDLTNRVALNKALAVLSVSGPQTTVIHGQWPATTNGPGAVRCAWLTNGAVLNGFTLRGGATRAAGDQWTLQSGGGLWCSSTNAMVVNCTLAGNSASSSGGGSFNGTLNNCTLAGNSAYLRGGGSSYGTLNNCLVSSNSAPSGGGVGSLNIAPFGTTTLNNCTLAGNSAGPGSGGGASSSILNNCTLTGNSAVKGAGGSSSDKLNNCIVWGNASSGVSSNYSSGTLRYTCTAPLAPGEGNISLDPQLVDGVHLAVTSPCRGMGATNGATGTDIDGEPWSSPPSMGCDEVWEAALMGPLAVAIQPQWTEVPARVAQSFTGTVTGRAARLEWSFGDGPTVTNAGWLTAHAWTNAGDYTVTLTAFNVDHPAGVSTNLLVHVLPVLAPQMAANFANGNVFQLSFTGQSNVTWVVEVATNLAPPVQWQTLKTLTGTGNVLTVQVPNATSTARFCRLRQP